MRLDNEGNADFDDREEPVVGCVAPDRLSNGLERTLDCRIHRGGIAVGAIWIAIPAGEIELNVRRPLINAAELESKTKMFTIARREIPEARKYHRREFEKVELRHPSDRIAWHAQITYARERENLSAWNKCLSAELISIVNKQARTQMKSWTRIPIDERFHRVKIQLRVIVDAVNLH